MIKRSPKHPNQDSRKHIAICKYPERNTIVEYKDSNTEKQKRQSIRQDMLDVAMDQGARKDPNETFKRARINSQKAQINMRIELNRKH